MLTPVWGGCRPEHSDHLGTHSHRKHTPESSYAEPLAGGTCKLLLFLPLEGLGLTTPPTHPSGHSLLCGDGRDPPQSRTCPLRHGPALPFAILSTPQLLLPQSRGQGRAGAPGRALPRETHQVEEVPFSKGESRSACFCKENLIPEARGPGSIPGTAFNQSGSRALD